MQWVTTINAMIDAGASSVVECGPGKVLAGLMRRINKSVPCNYVDTVRQLEKALQGEELKHDNSFSNRRVTGEVALVTGASRGIGAAIAAALAAAGATVVGTATSEAGAGAISETLGSKGRGVVLNIADDESVQAAMQDIQARRAARQFWSTMPGLPATIC